MVEAVFVLVNGRLLSYEGNSDRVAIPRGVTSIERFAFAFHNELCQIEIPDTVQQIGMGAFKGCTGLADSQGFVILRHMLHDYCGNQEQIVIPEGVRTIGYEAFYKQKNLRSVTVPDSVTAISNTAFALCKHLTLRGSSGGYAEHYATENRIPFERVK